MKKQYDNHYQILGIQPGASWKQLRKTYKKLVNRWHPDRYQQDLRQRKLAEEKTKEITQAYKELSEYYKKFDSLPMPGEESGNSSQETPEPPPPPVVHPSPEDLAAHDKQASGSPEPEPKSWFFKHPRRTLSAAGLIIGLYLLSLPDAPEFEDQAFIGEENPGAATNNVTKEIPAVKAQKGNYITIGSTIGEVYTIQGVPTRTEENIWYYGNSKILFSNGKVSGWEEGPENILRVSITPENNSSSSAYFHVGSSKQEVLAVQGPPDRDAGNVWDYGASRIYFENERVSRWHEAPFDRLKTRR